MIKRSNDFCNGCHLEVAKGDPDRVERNGVWHGTCLTIRRIKIRMQLQEQLKLLKGIGERTADETAT